MRRVSVPIVAVVALAMTAGVAAAAVIQRASSLHVPISVPSALDSNGRQVWVANTGSSSVIELSASNGKELLNVSGTKYHLDISDAITQVGNDVWVANSASNTVTEFYAKSGALKHVLKGPGFRLAVPVAIVAADKHVFVLDQAGDKVTDVVERTAKLARYLHGARYHLRDAIGMVRVGDDVWIASHGGGGTLTEISGATGGVMRVVTATAGHLDGPTAIATDGSTLWVANAHGSHLTVLNASNGVFLRAVTTDRVKLDHVASVSIAAGRVWLAGTTRPTFVAALLSRSGAVARIYVHRFGYPAVSADPRHVWVVDRLQSRVTELSARSGKVLRVISR